MNTVTQSLTKVCHYSLLGFLTFSSCSCTPGIQRRSAELWSLSVLYNSANVAHSGLMVCWQNTRLPPLGKWKAVPFSKCFSTPQLHTWRLSSPQLPQPCIRPGDATGWHHVCLSVSAVCWHFWVHKNLSVLFTNDPLRWNLQHSGKHLFNPKHTWD